MPASDSAPSACPRCGTAFVCGVVAGQTTCWCADMPKLHRLDARTTCLCRSCLQQALDAQRASGADQAQGEERFSA